MHYRTLFLVATSAVVLSAPLAFAGSDHEYPVRPIPFTAVDVADGFWTPRLLTSRQTTIPYCFKKCEETGRIDNFARAGGLMKAIAASHVIVGVGLLIPRLRFASGLLQLPMSLGITAFHATMLPAGLVVALVMLVLNALVLADRSRWQSLLAPASRQAG